MFFIFVQMEEENIKKEVQKDKKMQQENVVVPEDNNDIGIEPLMPELEKLVEKNPNRLIGCGG